LNLLHRLNVTEYRTKKARGIIAELIPNAGINFTSSLRFTVIIKAY
jgi:hypothetical protein